jgi:hypothetical protein
VVLNAALWGALALLAIVVGATIVMMLSLRSRIRKRKRELTDDIASSESRAEERAFNQLRLDESEIAVLGREGIDVTRAQTQLADARRAFDRRDFYSAYQGAKACHDGLVQARRTPVAPGPGAFALADPFGGAASATEAAGTEPARPPPPRNQMESRFQLSLLTEELAAAVRADPGASALATVHQLAAEARSQADRGDYTGALGTALRARRLLGGRVESVPPSAATAELPASTRSPAAEAEVASCPRCGRTNRPSDAFCRSCGSPVQVGPCARCGRPLEPGDQFCPGCGAAHAPGAGPTPSA